MSAVVDANVAIAVLNPSDRFHKVALRQCLKHQSIAILNITRAEALIHPTRQRKHSEANTALDQLGFRTEVLSNEVASQARELRAKYGNRNFPMVDAVVVGLGIALDLPVLTTDAKWPSIAEATIELIG